MELGNWVSEHLARSLVRGLDGDEVADLADHSADRRGVLEHDRLVRPAQTETRTGTCGASTVVNQKFFSAIVMLSP